MKTPDEVDCKYFDGHACLVLQQYGQIYRCAVIMGATKDCGYQEPRGDQSEENASGEA